jgi:hypothetical protein
MLSQFELELFRAVCRSSDRVTDVLTGHQPIRHNRARIGFLLRFRGVETVIIPGQVPYGPHARQSGHLTEQKI